MKNLIVKSIESNQTPIEHRIFFSIKKISIIKIIIKWLYSIAFDCRLLPSNMFYWTNQIFNWTQSSAIEHNWISWIIKECENSIEVRLPNAIEYQSNRLAFNWLPFVWLAIEVWFCSIDHPWTRQKVNFKINFVIICLMW